MSGLGFSSRPCKLSPRGTALAPFARGVSPANDIYPSSPLAVFQTVDQPAVVSGNYTAAGFCLAIAIFALALAWLQHKKRESAVALEYVQSDGLQPEQEEDEAAAGKHGKSFEVQINALRRGGSSDEIIH